MANAIWGAIFDFDGVIVDSEKMHESAWIAIAQEEGLPLDRSNFLKGFGLKNEPFIRTILKWDISREKLQEIIRKKEEIYQELVQKEGVTLVAGTQEWLKVLASHNIPCAIGSSAIRKNVDLVLEKSGLNHSFNAIVSGEDVHHGKPDPEVFLVCAQKLNLPYSHCVVFEDAPAGIEAAKRASMKAVALTTTFPQEKFQTTLFPPDKIVSRLDELSFDELSRWIQDFIAK